MDLKDRVVLITGAAQGLGEAISRTLASSGAKIVAVDIKQDLLNKLKKEILAEGKDIEIEVMDVSSEESIREVFSRIMEKHRRVDVLINNAGIDVTKPVDEIEIDECKKVISVNLLGPFILSKLAFKAMNITGGQIINITSTASKRAWANASAYHASKWGLLGLSHALHVEGRSKKIKVTAIIAGGMRTPFILERFPDTPKEVLQDPMNVAQVVRFVLQQPSETVIPEVMVLPVNETSWP